MDIYFDCGSGISGDMILAAFVDLGVPVEWLKQELARLPLDGFDIQESVVFRNGIRAKKIDVIDTHGDTDDGHTHGRHYAAIRSLIGGSPLPERVKQIALAAFEKLAKAEAVVHGVPLEKVHFHEVGGVDAIVDIVGAALCVAYLKVGKIAASAVPLGSGHVTCRHGVLPVPAPATVGILKGVPVYGTNVDCELVTPTGAALLTTLAAEFGPMPAMTMEKTGYGAGTREIAAMPNLLRLISGRFQTVGAADGHADLMMETCIDDMTPEIWGHVMERLFEAGARDVYLVPVHMKKNRPGILLCVLCDKAQRETLAACILSETTSIGVRYYPVERTMLARRPVTVNTSFGPVQAKAVTLPSGSTRIAPEYEACRKIALEHGVPILEVYRAVECGGVGE